MKQFSALSIIFLLLFQGCGGGNIKTNIRRKAAINQPFIISPKAITEGEKTATVINTTEMHSDYSGVKRIWKLKRDISAFPQLEADHHPLFVALYNMALEESLLDIRKDGAFMAGAKWNGVWTRDISYAIHLALAAIHPQISRKSLMAKVKNGEVVQDTGTGGSWPVSTDRVVWAIAAWELYRVTGSRVWLNKAYRILKKTALRDRHIAFEKKTGLYFGETSFLDWREQTYPSWMASIDIYRAKALSTNALHYRLLEILSKMAKRLGKAREGDRWLGWAKEVKRAINSRLWLPKKGYYTLFRYPELMGFNSSKSDSLGEALTVLFGIASPKRARTVVARTPLVHYGVPCIYPQQPTRRPYHNKGIWPFVQAYFAWAGSEVKNHAAVDHVFRSMMRAAGLFLTHKENFVFDTGNSIGTVINSDRQLWSVAGYLAMVYRVLFGIRYTPDGLIFKPLVPTFLKSNLRLKNFRYRKAMLDISVQGSGDRILSLTVNGKRKDAGFVLPAASRGKQRVVITLGGKPSGKITLGKTTAVAADESYIRHTLSGDGMLKMYWRKYRDADYFLLYRNGKLYKKTKDFKLMERIAMDRTLRFTVRAVNWQGIPSNYCETALVIPPQLIQKYEAEKAKRSDAPVGGKGGRYVTVYNRKSSAVAFKIQTVRNGKYILRFRFANGNGPVNTDNKCAIRSLSVDGRDTATVVLPQRMVWGNWGYSNPVVLQLKAGSHRIRLFYDNGDHNMNGVVNNARIDRLEVIQI